MAGTFWKDLKKKLTESIGASRKGKKTTNRYGSAKAGSKDVDDTSNELDKETGGDYAKAPEEKEEE